MWIWLLLRTWFSQITAVVWLGLAFISFIVEVSIPHFGFAFANIGGARIRSLRAQTCFAGTQITRIEGVNEEYL